MADPLADFRRAARRFEQDVARAMARATREASGILAEAMEGLAGAIGHSPADLAAMDHPYATRHPAGSGPFSDFVIHRQSGDFQDSIGRAAVVTTPEAVVGGVHITDRKAEWLLLGTPAMRPRDAVSAAIIYQEDAVANIFRKAHAAVHDEPAVQAGFTMDVTLGDHGAYPAELPAKE